jgi:hypothetical protein
MTPEPSTNNADGGHPLTYVLTCRGLHPLLLPCLGNIISSDESQYILRTTQDNVSPVWEHQGGQSEPHSRDDRVDFIQLCDDRRSHKGGRNSKPSTAPNDEYKALHKPLTAMNLHNHDLQIPHRYQLFNADSATENILAAGFEAVIAAAFGDSIDAVQEGDMTIHHNMFAEYLFQQNPMYLNRQNRRHSITSTHARDGLNTTTYRASERWSQSSQGEHTVSTPSYDDNCVEQRYWDTDHVKELTTWNNDLAGVGARFDEDTYEEYAGGDDIIVD